MIRVSSQSAFHYQKGSYVRRDMTLNLLLSILEIFKTEVNFPILESVYNKGCLFPG